VRKGFFAFLSRGLQFGLLYAAEFQGICSTCLTARDELGVLSIKGMNSKSATAIIEVQVKQLADSPW